MRLEEQFENDRSCDVAEQARWRGGGLDDDFGRGHGDLPGISSSGSLDGRGAEKRSFVRRRP